jgi:hypothetical protein
MTQLQIRETVSELVNNYGNRTSVAKIKAFFKLNHPTADISVVSQEAKELIAEFRSVVKRGY